MTLAPKVSVLWREREREREYKMCLLVLLYIVCVFEDGMCERKRDRYNKCVFLCGLNTSRVIFIQ